MDVKRKCKDLRAFDSSIVVAVEWVRTPPGVQLLWGVTGLQYLSQEGSKWPKKVPSRTWGAKTVDPGHHLLEKNMAPSWEEGKF